MLKQRLKYQLKYGKILNTILSISNFYKILGDNTGMHILFVLLNMTKSALSHQLATLKKTKIVKSKKIGKHVYYSLDDKHIELILSTSFEHLKEKSEDFCGNLHIF